MKIGVFPGSFNPPTLGHLDIIERASKLCDILYVAIIANPGKFNGPFNFQEKQGLLKEICSMFKNVKIMCFEGLLVDFIKNENINYIFRGLRSVDDFEFEKQMAIANKIMGGVETLFLISNPAYAHLSSSLIREIGTLGHSLKGFVPDAIENLILKKLKSL